MISISTWISITAHSRKYLIWLFQWTKTDCDCFSWFTCCLYNNDLPIEWLNVDKHRNGGHDVGSWLFCIPHCEHSWRFSHMFYGNKCCVIWSNVIIYSALNVQCTTVYSIFNTLLFVKRSGDGKSVVVCCFIHAISLKFQWHFINVIVMQWWGTKVIYSGYTRIFVMPLNW